jgi:hypothetical protein
MLGSLQDAEDLVQENAALDMLNPSGDSRCATSWQSEL